MNEPDEINAASSFILGASLVIQSVIRISEMTKEEKWFRRLKRCMKDMPKSVEIAVTDNYITLLPVGAVERSFEGRGDLDHFDEESIDYFHHPRITTCGESL